MSSALPPIVALHQRHRGRRRLPCSSMRPSAARLRARARSRSACRRAFSGSADWRRSGRPTCCGRARIGRARCQQNSAAPMVPQATAVARLLRQPKGRPGLGIGQQVFSGTKGAVEHEFAGDRARSDSLPSIRGVEKALVARSTMKPRNHPVELRPDDRDIAKGAFDIHILCPVSRVAAGPFSAASPSSPDRSRGRRRSGRSSRRARRFASPADIFLRAVVP